MRRFASIGLLLALQCGSSTTNSDGGGSPLDAGAVEDGGLVCSGGTTRCGDTCVELAVDPANCGACAIHCPMGLVCSGGACALQCQVGYSTCTRTDADGGTIQFCTDLTSDDQNCGTCGSACSNKGGLGVCINGVCNTKCVGTFAECDGNPATVCESDLFTDTKNCGACGHDCLGGTCTLGQCQPVVLASNQNTPWNLAVDATNVYWTNLYGGEVRACSKSACNNNPTTLATNQAMPQPIAVDASFVYWANATGNNGGGQIQKCAIGGCSGTPTSIATNQGSASGLALDATNAYWTSGSWNGVFTCPKSGCGGPPTQLAVTLNAFSIAVDGSNAYYTGSGRVEKCSLSGCGNNPTPLANIGGYAIAIDANNAYWTSNNGVVAKCALAGCGGNPTMLVQNIGSTFGIAVDGTDVYFTQPYAGSIARCAIAGCNMKPTTLATLQGQPEHVTVDATAIYWTSSSAGTVMKLAK